VWLANADICVDHPVTFLATKRSCTSSANRDFPTPGGPSTVTTRAAGSLMMRRTSDKPSWLSRREV